MDETSLNNASDVTANVEPSVVAGISLTPTAQHYLDQTKPWVRFFSIMIFIGAAFCALAGVLVVIMGALASEAVRSMPGGPLLGLFYVALAVLYIPPGVFLSRYAGAIRSLKSNLDAQSLEDAMRHQKTFWRYVGILTIIGVALGILMAVLVFVLSLSLLLSR
jgi:hypothetical protein